MKKITFALITFFVVTACNNDDQVQTPQPGATEIQDIMINGQWEITYFLESDEVKTDNFTGYTFTFTSDRSISAASASGTINGSWMVTEDDMPNVNELDNVDFNISYAAPSKFVELNEDWEIFSISETKLELTHIGGSTGNTNLLTFEKI
jgi:hypothetical protein